MEKDIKKLSGDMIDISIASIFAGASIGVVNSSPLPATFKTGTNSIISLGLLKGVSDKIK